MSDHPSGVHALASNCQADHPLGTRRTTWVKGEKCRGHSSGTSRLRGCSGALRRNSSIEKRRRLFGGPWLPPCLLLRLVGPLGDLILSSSGPILQRM
eukprot:9501352-Pyramimonas_sp.AAC.1